MTVRRLTVEIARQFLEEPEAVDTSRFSQIDDAAAKVFRYREGVLNLDGLRRLSEKSMREVANFWGELSLGGLNRISVSDARRLAKHGKHLHLDGLTASK